MKAKHWITLVAMLALSCTVFSQGLVGKLKQKAAQAAENAVDKKVDDKTGVNNQQSNTGLPGSNTGPGGPANTTGGGLVVSPPNVKENISEAETLYKSGNYSDARFALKQAMLGVEMEIGNNVLRSLPESVAGLKKDAEADQVTSMGYGWVGLTIHREYGAGNKQLNVTIANNSAWMSAVNMYLSNANYASSGSQQNWKQTKVKGHRGIIEYDDSTGYKLSVPIGQSSLIVWEGINFASEQEMMSAANAFDIDNIKVKLGEK